MTWFQLNAVRTAVEAAELNCGYCAVFMDFQHGSGFAVTSATNSVVPDKARGPSGYAGVLPFLIRTGYTHL